MTKLEVATQLGTTPHLCGQYIEFLRSRTAVVQFSCRAVQYIWDRSLEGIRYLQGLRPSFPNFHICMFTHYRQLRPWNKLWTLAALHTR